MLAGYVWTAVLATLVAISAIFAVRAISTRSRNFHFKRNALVTGIAIAPALILGGLWSDVRTQFVLLYAVIGVAVGAILYRSRHLQPGLRRVLTVSVAGTIAVASVCWGPWIWHLNEDGMPRGNCGYLESLKLESAQADADRALSRGDSHLIGIYGYALMAPGVDIDAANFDRAVKRIRPVECTSDTPTPRQRRLQIIATQYADQYNRRVLERSGRP